MGHNFQTIEQSIVMLRAYEASKIQLLTCPSEKLNSLLDVARRGSRVGIQMTRSAADQEANDRVESWQNGIQVLGADIQAITNEEGEVAKVVEDEALHIKDLIDWLCLPLELF